jgi:ABC-type amino acid transport substrate-binding protein
MSRLSRFLFMLMTVIILAGCQPAKTKGLLNTLAARPPLKVGITTDSPPLAYKKDEVISWAGGRVCRRPGQIGRKKPGVGRVAA